MNHEDAFVSRKQVDNCGDGKEISDHKQNTQRRSRLELGTLVRWKYGASSPHILGAVMIVHKSLSKGDTSRVPIFGIRKIGYSIIVPKVQGN